MFAAPFGSEADGDDEEEEEQEPGGHGAPELPASADPDEEEELRAAAESIFRAQMESLEDPILPSDDEDEGPCPSTEHVPKKRKTARAGRKPSFFDAAELAGPDVAYVSFDIEKTATGNYTGSIGNCQWAFVVFASPGLPADLRSATHDSLIKPDPNFSEWSSFCTAVHGITAEKVSKTQRHLLFLCTAISCV